MYRKIAPENISDKMIDAMLIAFAFYLLIIMFPLPLTILSPIGMGFACYMYAMAKKDGELIAAAGLKAPSAWWAFFITPVYLWKRSKMLKKNQTPLFTWVVIFILSILMGSFIEEFIEGFMQGFAMAL